MVVSGTLGSQAYLVDLAPEASYSDSDSDSSLGLPLLVRRHSAQCKWCKICPSAPSTGPRVMPFCARAIFQVSRGESHQGRIRGVPLAPL